MFYHRIYYLRPIVVLVLPREVFKNTLPHVVSFHSSHYFFSFCLLKRVIRINMTILFYLHWEWRWIKDYNETISLFCFSFPETHSTWKTNERAWKNCEEKAAEWMQYSSQSASRVPHQFNYRAWTWLGCGFFVIHRCFRSVNNIWWPYWHPTCRGTFYVSAVFFLSHFIFHFFLNIQHVSRDLSFVMEILKS